MSTRSFIIRKIDDNSFEGIYCHFDGYPSGVGAVLLDSFDYDKTVALLKLGNISQLHRNLYPKTKQHTFDTPEKDVVVAYHRDRNEDKECSGSTLFFNFDIDKIQINCPYADIDWFYMIDNTGTWFVKKYSWKSWKLLSKIVNQSNKGY